MVMNLIGYLAPDGKFTQCLSGNHRYCAESICNRIGVDKSAYEKFGAETYLLENGYICFRASNIYMHPQKHSKHFEECNYITPEQYNFLIEAQNDDDITLSKYDDIQEIIDYQVILHKEYNKGGTRNAKKELRGNSA